MRRQRRNGTVSKLKNRRRRVSLLLLLPVLLLLVAFASADGLEAEKMAFLRRGTSADGKQVTLYAEAAKKAPSVAVMEGSDSCEILGEDGKYFYVRWGEYTGYVGKSRLDLSSVRADSEVPEALCASLSLVDPIPERHEDYLVLTGEITSDQPLHTLFIYLWNDRTFQVEMCVMKTPETPSSRLDTAFLAHAIPLNKLTGGRKTLVVEGVTEAGIAVLFRSTVYVCGKAEEPAHVTGLCTGIPNVLRDEKVSSAWRPTASAPSLTVSVPEEAHAELMTLEWKRPSSAFTVEQFNDAGEVLSSLRKEGGTYSDYVELSPDTRRITVTPEKLTCDLSTLRIYADPYSSHAVQCWDPIPDKIDILFIAAHQDDELLFFGGAIPYYAFRDDVKVAVLYMATCSRIRVREALDGLWTAGLKVHPIFLGLEDIKIYNLQEALAKWNEYNPDASLVEVIRKYRPEVVVCQDFDGEYGHGQHKAAAALTAEAVERAAKETEETESAARWGTWQVKKLYVHLYQKEQIHMDWNTPLVEGGVVTPLFLCKEAYDKHRSQQAYFSVHRQGVTYDNTLFGLYSTTVGPDLEKNDLMENIR